MANTKVTSAVIADGAITPSKIASGDFYFDTDTLYVDSTNNRVGIGTTSPAEMLHVTGDVRVDTDLYIQPTNKFYLDGGLDTYLTEVAANTMAFNVAGAERMRLDTDGYLRLSESSKTLYGTYVGLVTPNGTLITDDTAAAGSALTLLHNSYINSSNNFAYMNTDEAAMMQMFNGSIIFKNAASGTADTTVSFSERMRIDSSGNVGIGTSSPTSKLHVNAGTYAGYAVDLVQEGSGGGNHGLRVVSGSGSSYTAIFRANASTVFYVDGAGNYYFSGSNQSDVNKKENIADITDSALDLITQLQPKTYNFIGSDIDKAGFIAQDMEQVIPRLVTGNEFDPELTDEDGNNPTGKGIDYMGYTAYLTKAIQEQQTIIDDLKARIETLENA